MSDIEAVFSDSNEWERGDICYIYPRGEKMFYILQFFGCSAVIKEVHGSGELVVKINDLEVTAEDAMTGEYRGTL